MPNLKMPSYMVIRDTREKEGHGWDFVNNENKKRPPSCLGTISQTLTNGDYSLVGYEDIVTIERKKNFSELWTNYQERAKFEEKMGRLSQVKYPFLLIETPLSSDHLDLTPPQFTTNVPGKVIITWLLKISMMYNVRVMNVSDCGQRVAQHIFEEVVRLERDKWVH